MNSYFCYVRTTDNQFFSCSVACDETNDMKMAELAYKQFAKVGNPLPPAYQIARMRFVADPRNAMDATGYPPVDDAPHGDPDSYCVASEYENGKTPTH